MARNNTKNSSEKCAQRGGRVFSVDEAQAFCSRILGVISAKQASFKLGTIVSNLKLVLICGLISDGF